MNYLSEEKINRVDTILIPNISMIILSSLFTKLKNYMILFLIFYLVLDFVYTFLISKKELLIDTKNYYINSIITLGIGIIIYQFFLTKVEYAYVDMEVFKNFIWVMIIMYFYNKLNIKSIKLEKFETDNYDKYYREFVVVTYAKLKNKYGYLIKSSKEIEDILYSFMINDTLKKNKNIISLIKDRLRTKEKITMEEYIVTTKEKLENKVKRIRNKQNIVDSLIKDNYKDSSDIENIKKILDIIKEF